jgi:3-methyladenine DNA glycosylase Tag
MRSFSKIEAMAGKLHGGVKGIAAKLKEHPGGGAKDVLKGDDRLLAGMTQAVFSAGFNWKVIEIKWPGFEEAFHGFNPKAYGDDDLERLLGDRRIVRNGAKVMATIENARFVVATAKEHSSFGQFLKAWPASDQIGLMEHLKKNASRLGGNSAMYFLRFNGWDAFILSRDVVAALMREGVIDKPPTSKKDMRAVQAAFNAWTEESGRPQREVSRILAWSVG